MKIQWLNGLHLSFILGFTFLIYIIYDVSRYVKASVVNYEVKIMTSERDISLVTVSGGSV